MPKYEYACKSCGEHLEVVQSFKDDALTECPACRGPLRKVFGAIGVVLKGSGFYRTDNRTRPKSEGARADSKSSDSKLSDSKSSESGSKSSEPGSKSSEPGSKSSEPTSTSSSGRAAKPEAKTA